MSRYSDKRKTTVFCVGCKQLGLAMPASHLVVIDGKPEWVCPTHKEQNG